MNLKAVLSVARKDVILISRDKMQLFFLIAYPIMLLFFTATIFIPAPKPVTLNIGVVYNDPTISKYGFNATTVVNMMNKTKLEEVEVFMVRIFNTEDEVTDALRRGELDAAMVFPPKFSENASLSLTSGLRVLVGTVDIYRAQLSEAILRAFIDQLSKNITIERIDFAQQYIPTSNATWGEIRLYLYGLSFPLNATIYEIAPETVATREGTMGVFTVGMIGVQFLFTGMMQAANAIAAEKERKTLRRILSTPISTWELLLGKTLAILASLVLTTAICLLFGIAIGAKISWAPLENPAYLMVPVLLFLGSILTIGIGLTISSICKSTEAGSGITMVIAFPLIFISGIWMPKSMLPPVLQRFAEVFPLTQTIDAVREIMVYGGDMAKIIPVIPSVVISAIAVYVIGTVLFNWSVKKEY